MRTLRTPEEVREAVQRWRAVGERIAFVPTMGALHEGHLSLVDLALEYGDRTVVSIFVNPTQFEEAHDLEAYPRRPEADAEVLAARGCDLLFLPEASTIYAEGHATFVEPAGAAEGLEGAFRPGHFRGVATVVTQLFNIVAPDLAVFGDKDAQQLAVVRQLVRDLHFPIEIVAGPTVREADGLAMSSRNARLDPDERRAATAFHAALEAAHELVAEGERDAEAVRRRMRDVVAAEPRAELDYAEVVDAATFQPLERVEGAVVVPIAGRIGDTRLIDNLRLEVTTPGDPVEVTTRSGAVR